MFLAVLRITTDEFCLDDLVSELPADLVEDIWSKGDVRLGGRVQSTTGARLVLVDEEDGVLAAQAVAACLRQIAPTISRFSADIGGAVLDLGVGVDEQHPNRSWSLDSALLDLLVSLRLSLTLSCYLSDEEEN